MTKEFFETLSEDFSHLLDQPDDYNVSLEIGEEPNIKIFKTHSVILRARCSYFRAALSNEWVRKEDEKFVFKKSNISCTVFEIILRYIYSGKALLEQLEGSEILDLITASDELFLNELFDYSQEYLIEYKAEWVRQNLVHALQVAFRHDACISLQNFCFGLVNENAWALFQSEEFISIDEMVLISLLKRDDFSVEEIDIWNFVINWGIKQTPSILERDISKWTFEDFTLLGTTLRNLIPFIRLYQITSKDFYHRVWPFEKILNKDLKEGLLSFYLTQESPKHGSLPEPRILQKNIDSEIISYNHAALIASWISRNNPQSLSDLYSHLNLTSTYFDTKDLKIIDKGIKVPYRLRLIYRASRDGFNFDSFHKHVDNKGPAVVFIKIGNKYSECIGGYNPVGWYSYGSYIATGDSFIFCLPLNEDGSHQNNHKISRIRPYFIDGAIFDTSNHGACFGYGDIWFGNRERPRYGSCTRVYYENTIRDTENEFYAEEMEVFQVLEN